MAMRRSYFAAKRPMMRSSIDKGNMTHVTTYSASVFCSTAYVSQTSRWRYRHDLTQPDELDPKASAEEG